MKPLPIIISSLLATVLETQVSSAQSGEVTSFKGGEWLGVYYNHPFQELLPPPSLENALGHPKIGNLESTRIPYGSAAMYGLKDEKCFRDGYGPDLFVHEPYTHGGHYPERFSVGVMDESGNWYLMKKFLSIDSNGEEGISLGEADPNRYVPIDFSEFVPPEAGHLSRLVIIDGGSYSPVQGIDFSAAYIVHPCQFFVLNLNSNQGNS